MRSQNRLFQNTGKGTFVDVTRKSGLFARQAFSTSALWFDFDRDGLLDLFVCNYVNWSPEHDVFAAWMENKSRIALRKRTAVKRAGSFAIAATEHSRMRRPQAASSIRVRNHWASRCLISIRRLARPARRE